MATYRTGTITVTNGSKTVTGASTLFKTAGVVSGDQLYIVDANNIPTGYLYEVDVVDSDTLITLKQNYQGATISDQSYMIMNMAGNQTVPNFAARLAPIMQSWGDITENINTTPQINGIPQAGETGKIDSGWLSDTSTTVKGVVKVGTNLSATNGVISVADASNAVKGVVKVGSNISVADGIISVSDASTLVKGTVKVGTNLSVADGVISVPNASETVKGVVKVGSNISVADGVISVPEATEIVPGVDWRRSPIGSIIIYPVNDVPDHCLECNGAEISRETYSDLFAVLGTTYGAGDGSTTFQIPDLRGEFIRGWDHSSGIDASRAIGSGVPHVCGDEPQSGIDALYQG